MPILSKTSDFSKLIVGLMAAGESKRFQQGNKLLTPLKDQTLIETTSQVLTCLFNKVYVVTGFEEKKIKTLLTNPVFHFIHNQDFQRGLGSSLSAFIKKAHEDPTALGALIHFADLPHIHSHHIEKLVSSFFLQPDKIHVSRFSSTFGPPLIIPSKFYKIFLDQVENIGAKKWMKQQKLQFVDLPEASKDIDVIEDL